MGIELGPFLGAVGPSEARIWFRASDAQPYRVAVRNSAGTSVPGSPFLAPPGGLANATTVVVPLPVPFAEYSYDILDAAGASVLPDGLAPPVFWSAPADATSGSACFAVVSCNNMSETGFYRRDQREAMWKRLATLVGTRDVAALLAVGDQVYADDAWEKSASRSNVFAPTLRRDYWDSYQLHWDWPAIRGVLSGTPSYMIWDDHEIRDGWGSERLDGTADVRRQRFAVAREVYREFQHAHNPAPQAPFTAGDLCFGFRYGDIGCLFLDLRGKRDCGRQTDPVLGAPQWQKIQAWLDAQAPELGALIVVSSVPPVHVKHLLVDLGALVNSDLRDQWSVPANRPEQARLFRRLFDLSNSYDVPVVIVGGDVHVGTISSVRSTRPEHEARPLIYQLTSSPISNRPLPDPLVRALEGHRVDIDDDTWGSVMVARGCRNFGLVDFTHEPGGYRVALELHLDGEDDPIRLALP